MTTKTATDATDVDAEYQHLALLASQGDAAASKKLVTLEDRQDALARAERRQVAAALEVQRLATEAAAKAIADAQLANEEQHAKFLEQREAVYAEIETLTGKLAAEVQLCLAVDQELWASALRCGWRPETRTKSRITDYISSQLGREGAGGLTDMPMVNPGLLESHLTRLPVQES